MVHLRTLSYISLLFSGTLHSVGYTFPFSFAFLSFSQLFVRPPQTTVLPFCISFSWGWFWSPPPAQCHEPPSIVLQAFFYQIWSLESINHLHCINIRDLIYVIPECLSGFPYFMQLDPEFCYKELMSWAIVSSRSCFYDCIELLHLWLQRI